MSKTRLFANKIAKLNKKRRNLLSKKRKQLNLSSVLKENLSSYATKLANNPTQTSKNPTSDQKILELMQSTKTRLFPKIDSARKHLKTNSRHHFNRSALTIHSTSTKKLKPRKSKRK